MVRQGEGGQLIDRSLTFLSVGLMGLALWFAITLEVTRTEYAILFLGLAMIISTLTVLQKGSFLKLRGKWLLGLAFLLIALSLAPSIYFFLQYEDIALFRAGDYTNTDYLLGTLILVPLLLLTLKEAGVVLFVLILFFLFYSFFGYLFPGILFHSGMGFFRLIQIDVLEMEAVYGLILGVIATWVALFLLYAGLIRGFGALDVIVKLLYHLFGGKRYLMPQIPVVTSLIFGSFSGSPSANVAGTGSFTIPLLKRFGVPPKMAGAIEAVASSGGQVMPPIMGAIAFLMVAILGVPYLHIVVIGFIPALIFYAGTAAATYWSTKPFITIAPLSVLGEEDSRLSRSELGKLAPLVISVIVLFTYLALMMPIMRSVVYGIYAFFVVQIIYELLTIRGRPIRRVVGEFARNLLTGLRFAAIPAAMVAILGGCLGIAIKALTATALGPKLSFQLIELSQGMLPLMLFLILLLCMVFGMTAGGIATYIVVVSIVAVPLIDFGIEPIITHFMIFYLGSAALITPPVAGAALVASSIAGTPYIATAWTAMKLGIPLFILPMAFATYPELLLISSQTPLAIALVLTGVIGISYGVHVPEKGWKILVKRVICLVAAGFALFHPAAVVHISAAVIIVVLLAGGLLLRRIRYIFG